MISGFGLSAFLFSTLAHVLYPGDVSSMLLLLSLGTSLPMILGFFFVRPIPLPPDSYIPVNNAAPGERRMSFTESITGDEIAHSTFVADAVVYGHVGDSRTNLLSISPSRPVGGEARGADEGQTLNYENSRSVEMSVSPPRHGPRHRSISSFRHNRLDSSLAAPVERDLHGKTLLACGDFWLLFVLLTLRMCSLWSSPLQRVTNILFSKRHWAHV